MKNLPELIREQRASVEDSLEWTVAHTVAHQWWGEVVGNDPERAPVLDEALANWSALAYYQETHGETRRRCARRPTARRLSNLSNLRRRRFNGCASAREYRNFFSTRRL
jgi:hypothetical protein